MEIDFGVRPDLFCSCFSASYEGDDLLTEREKDISRDYALKRQRDFAMGRMCAKRALTKLGCTQTEILAGTHHEPLWPTGYIGSISHSKNLAGALAARSDTLCAIGLDIEGIGEVKPDMWQLLYTEEEQAFLRAFNEEEQAFYTTLYFSMKESFYKLQFPLTETMLNFTDVAIEQNKDSFRLTIKKIFDGRKKLPQYTPLHFTTSGNEIISMCYLER